MNWITNRRIANAAELQTTLGFNSLVWANSQFAHSET